MRSELPLHVRVSALVVDEPAPELEAQAAFPEAVKLIDDAPADMALGFMPHRGDNRRSRLTGAAQFVPPKDAGITRREMVKQRQKKRRGKLDPELRRLQRKAIENGTDKR